MITTHNCVSAACDVCKEKFEGGYDGIRHFDDEADAHEQLREYEWHVGLDGSIVCPVDNAAHWDAIREQHAAGMEPDHWCWILSADEDEADEMNDDTKPGG